MRFKSLMLTAAIYSAVTLTSVKADISFYCGDNDKPSITIYYDGSAVVAEDYSEEQLNRIVITGALPTDNFGYIKLIFKALHNAFTLNQQQDITIEIKDIKKDDYKKVIPYIVPNLHRIKKLTVSNVCYDFMTDISTEIAKHSGDLFTDDVVVEFDNLSYNNGGWWYTEEGAKQGLFGSMLTSVSFKKQNEKQWFGNMAGLINKLQNVSEFTISRVSPSFMNCLATAFSNRTNRIPFLKPGASFVFKAPIEADSSLDSYVNWSTESFNAVKQLKGISKLSIHNVSDLILQQISAELKNSNALNDGCSVVLQDISGTTQKAAIDLKNILLPQVADFSINFTSVPGYVYVSDYKNTKLVNLTIRGNTCWSDLMDFVEHHGGFLTVLKLPASVQSLTYEATPWKDSLGYLGYSGLALYTEKISSNFKLSMTPLVSAFYLVLPDNKWDNFIENTFPEQFVDFLNRDNAKILGSVTVPSGPFGKTTCYQPDKKKRFFYITHETAIKEILSSKSISDSDYLQPIGGNGKITMDDAKVYQTQEKRTELINKFNAESSGKTIDLTQSTMKAIKETDNKKNSAQPKSSNLNIEMPIIDSGETSFVQPKIVIDSTTSTGSSSEDKSTLPGAATPTAGSGVPPPPSIPVGGIKKNKNDEEKTDTAKKSTTMTTEKSDKKPDQGDSRPLSATMIQEQIMKLNKTKTDNKMEAKPLAPAVDENKKKISEMSKTVEGENTSAVKPANPSKRPIVEVRKTKSVTIETPIAQPKIGISSSSPSEDKSKSPESPKSDSTTVGKGKTTGTDKVEEVQNSKPQATVVEDKRAQSDKTPQNPLAAGVPPVPTNIQPPKTISAPVVKTNPTVDATRGASAPALSFEEQIAAKAQNRNLDNITALENRIQEQARNKQDDGVDPLTAALRGVMQDRRIGMGYDDGDDTTSSTSDDWDD